MTTLYVCVITYQYDGRTFKISSKAMPEQRAAWLAGESNRLFTGNTHVVSAEVLPESPDELKRAVAAAVLVS